MSVEVKDNGGSLESLIKGLAFIATNDVYVGIQEKDTKRKKNKDDIAITNAELLFIHTNGSPINNVPARPVIEPAIKDDAERLSGMMKKVAQLAFDDKLTEARRQLSLTGMRGQNVCRNWFTNPKNGWPPNSPSVQAEKRRKGSTDPKPLIDTGELRKSITYFIKTIGGRQK